MKINRLELENIKSYESGTFEFAKGLNFICGNNGAGKTTLIESIGFALFDYKIVKQNFAQYFVKKGEKKGKVKVFFLDKNNEEYIAERKIGLQNTVNNWSIKQKQDDCEIAIVAGDEEVKAWLKDHFEFYKEDNISDVYSKIIGVPQGEFTVAFLESDSKRKEIFDPLFKLEGYKKAFQNIKLESGFTEKIRVLENSISENKGEIKSLVEKEQSFETIKENLSNKKEVFETLQKQLETITQKFLQMEKTKTEIEKIEQELIMLNLIKEKNKEQIENKQKEIESIKNALDKVSKNKEAYENYKNYIEERKQKEEEYKEYLIKKQELEELTIRIEKGNVQIEEKQKKLKIDLDIIKKIEDEFKNQNDNIQNQTNILLKETKKIQQQKQQVDNLKNEIEQIYDEIQKNSSEAKMQFVLKENIDKIEEELKNFDKIEKDIDNYKIKLEEKKQYTSELEVLKENINKLEAQKKMLEKNEQYLKEGVCPFLKEQCINLKQNNSLEVEKVNITDKLEVLYVQLKELEKMLNSYKEVEEKLPKLQNQYEVLINKKVEKDQKKEQLKEIETKININIENIKNIVLNHIKIQENTEITEMYKLIKEQYEKVFECWNKENGELQRKQATIKEKIEQAKKLQIDYENKKQNYDEEQKELIKWNSALENLKKKQAEIVKQVENLQNTRETIEKLNQQIDLLQESYNIYIANEKEAKKHENVIKDYAKLTKEKQDLDQKFILLDEKLKTLKQEFNIDIYTNIKSELDQKKLNINSIKIEFETLENQKKVLKQEIENMKAIKKQIKEKEKEIEKYTKAQNILKKIRNIIKMAPEAIAHVLIQNISEKSSEIYTKIAADNSKLEWEKSYSLILNDFADEQVIKKEFKQLSGGEQMTAALSVRLAMIELLTDLKIGILDEPTINMDTGRRERLAETIEYMSSNFNQLFIVSHDDTFHSITENIIDVGKN